MKSAMLVCVFLLSWGLQVSQGQNAENEIKKTIADMIQAGVSKDLDKTMSYWDNSSSFVYIADGKQYNYQQFKEMYIGFLENVENNEVTESDVTVKEIGKYKALCVWTGAETVKMKDQSTIKTKWISTLVMENKKGGWIILHGHTSHY